MLQAKYKGKLEFWKYEKIWNLRVWDSFIRLWKNIKFSEIHNLRCLGNGNTYKIWQEDVKKTTSTKTGLNIIA